MTAASQARDRQTGRYGFSGRFDRLCACGHPLGHHTAEAPHEFINQHVGDGQPCDCDCFRPPGTRR